MEKDEIETSEKNNITLSQKINKSVLIVILLWIICIGIFIAMCWWIVILAVPSHSYSLSFDDAATRQIIFWTIIFGMIFPFLKKKWFTILDIFNVCLYIIFYVIMFFLFLMLISVIFQVIF